MYHGWKIVAVAFTANFVAAGFVMYSYGVLFKALAAEFGGTRLGVASGLALMQIAMSVFSPLLGRALDGGSIRNIMVAGALTAATGFLLATQMTALWQWYVLLVTLIGIGTASLGSLAANTLVARWFAARRGIALGISAMGVSLSGAVMAPVASVLLNAIGWRGAFGVYAGILVVLVIPLLWRFARTPEDLGLPAEDEALEEGASGPVSPPAARAAVPSAAAVPASLLRERNFWVITLAMGLNFGVNAALVTHIVPHGTDLGFSPTDAALALSLIGGLAAAGKPVFGRIADRLDMRLAFGLAAGFQIAGLTVLGASSGYAMVLVAGGLYGFGMGGLIPIWGSVVGAAFGRLAFGRASGLTLLWMLPIQIIPNPLAGHLYDLLGSYDLAFRVMLAHLAASVLVFLLLRLPAVEPAR